ncbi:MAG: hypothetical protein GEEBNDBF_02258 [bacterium]|nr:hypothetical protein [bacterium]
MLRSLMSLLATASVTTALLLGCQSTKRPESTAPAPSSAAVPDRSGEEAASTSSLLTPDMRHSMVLSQEYKNSVRNYFVATGEWPASGQALIDSGLLCHVPTTANQQPARLIAWDGMSPLESDAVGVFAAADQVTFGFPEALRHSPLTPATLQIARTPEWQAETDTFISVHGLERTPRVELLEFRSSQVAQGKTYPVMSYLNVSGEMRDRAVGALRVSTQALLTHYRQEYGTWPDSWDQALAALRLAPASYQVLPSSAPLGPEETGVALACDGAGDQVRITIKPWIPESVELWYRFSDAATAEASLVMLQTTPADPPAVVPLATLRLNIE